MEKRSFSLVNRQRLYALLMLQMCSNNFVFASEHSKELTFEGPPKNSPVRNREAPKEALSTTTSLSEMAQHQRELALQESLDKQLLWAQCYQPATQELESANITKQSTTS